LKVSWLLAFAALLALAGAACTNAATPAAQGPSGPDFVAAPGGTVRTFDLTAAPARIELRPGLTVQAWAYNGTVPGPVIRVDEGDLVRVRLHNHLTVATTIHWHGLAVPNGQDGVAGVTQDPVPPGGSVTYSFVAKGVGTYWYHSHQRGSYQIDRGLYGLFIVEPRGRQVDHRNDQFLVYDEWPIGLEMPSPPPAGDPAMSAYVTVSINGKTGDAIEPIHITPGTTIQLRLLNAGYLVHFVRIQDIPVTVVAFDGHAVVGGPATLDALPLGPGERLDVEFAAPERATRVALQDPFPPSTDAVITLEPDGGPPPGAPTPASSQFMPVLDFFTYGARAAVSPWPVRGTATRAFTLRLSEVSLTPGSSVAPMPGMEMGDVHYEINGAVFPDTGTLAVSQGDLVAIAFVNDGRQDHPMHLHGHAFQLLERNGITVTGVIVKDTVVVRPGSSVTVGFLADNPGWWMIHCHQLHHAAGGMMVLLRYLGSPRLAQIGGPFQSAPD
jgi:FtsP/CotA-like multicopper oxidase with cupredoxin domain